MTIQEERDRHNQSLWCDVQLQNENAALKARIAELEQDAARLNLLLSGSDSFHLVTPTFSAWIHFKVGDAGECLIYLKHKCSDETPEPIRAANPRDAIDAAIKVVAAMKESEKLNANES